MLEVGKLYICNDYFLLLYPDREATAAAPAPAVAAAAAADPPRWHLWNAAAAAVATRYWSRELGKPVSYCDPETPLLVLNAENQYVEVLAGDKRGWIINEERFKIEEIIDEAA